MEEIRKAGPADAEAIAPLLDAYRQFFTQESRLAESLEFIQQRLTREESVVFVGEVDGEICGFAQLYPLFSSWHAKRIWFLSDLYVAEQARGHGLAKRIIEAVKDCASQTQAASVMVELPKGETHLYRFYEALGFHQDKIFDLARYHPK